MVAASRWFAEVGPTSQHGKLLWPLQDTGEALARSFIVFVTNQLFNLSVGLDPTDCTDPLRGYLTPVWGVAIRETGTLPSARYAKELSRGWDGGCRGSLTTSAA